MALGARWSAWRSRPARRPKGGTAQRDAYVPDVPEAATGTPPPPLEPTFAAAGVAPPRPLVWVGTASSGAAVWSSPVANGAGLGLWREMREAAEATGAWPVLTGSAPLPPSWHLDRGQRADAVDLPDGEALLRSARGSLPEPEDGLRTRLEPAAEPTVEADLSAGYLGLVTEVAGWDLPAAVGFDGVGGWSAAEHAAVLRMLGERYGAEVAALTRDSVGLVVRRPPRTHEDAFAAAELVYAYCPDVVTRGVRTLWALATTVAVSPAWSLRWAPRPRSPR